MMRVTPRLYFFLAMFCAVVAHAQTYERDVKFLRGALQIWGFNDENMDRFSNPYIGPTEFRLSEAHAPWSGNYFAMKHGGIANRWQVGEKRFPRLHQLPTKEQVLEMTSEQVNLLSPAEKYDIFKGDYNFSMTKQELFSRGPMRGLKPKIWEGFCNGVRCASTIFPEPKTSVVVKNRDGVAIKFQSSDLKALAGATYFFVEKYAQMGAPTVQDKAEAQPNAAVFDLALRYFLAQKKKSFMVDANLGKQIWNESVIGYHREVSPPKELTADEQWLRPWAIAKVQVEGYLETLGEVDIEKTNGPTVKKIAEGELHEKLPISYVLYIDAQGSALDGKWNKSKNLRGVDFVWFGAGEGTDSHPSNRWGNGNPYLEFKTLKKLIHMSAAQSCRKLFTD
ncbi:MAG: hypothetical protein H7328_06280 [Bdellovibrio sp.]|nr:hypothetical protein [Bdellovibrio sp.]